MIWLLTVILSLAMWGYALYRIHTTNFNLIEFFKKEKAKRGTYESFTQAEIYVLGSLLATALFCLIPALNIITGLILVGGAFAIPFGQKFWGWIQKVGK